MAIPAGSPGASKSKHLVRNETNRKVNEIQALASASVSLEIPADRLDAKKKIAAPTAIGNGDTSEKHTNAFRSNSYHTVPAAAIIAGRWYRENREHCVRHVVPTLRAKFGLSALQAVQAIRMANGGAS